MRERRGEGTPGSLIIPAHAEERDNDKRRGERERKRERSASISGVTFLRRWARAPAQTSERCEKQVMALKCIRQLRAMNTVHEYPALRTRGEEHVRAHVFFWTRCPSARVERGGQAASWGPLRGPHQVEKIRSIRPRMLYYIYIERRGISRGLRFLSTSSIELVRVRPCYYCARSVYLSLFLSLSFSFWLPDSCFFVSHRELFEVRFGEVLRGIVKLLENCR